MRSPFIPLAVVVFALACADTPTAPSLIPGEPRLADYPPPPWAETSGEIAEDGSFAIIPLMSRAGSGQARGAHIPAGPASYTAMLLIDPHENIAWLKFTEGHGVTFSKGARLMRTKKGVSGIGTVTFAASGQTYELSSVTEFNAYRECTTAPGARCADFDGEGFSSAGPATWTGRIASDGGGGGPPDWDGGKPGNGPPPCLKDDCFIIGIGDFQ